MKHVELDRGARLASRGVTSAMSSLSRMVGRDIGISSFAVQQVPVAEICHLMGGSEAVTVGIYVAVSGGADGHILLMCEPKTAHGLVDMVMQMPQGSTRSLGEVERSALGELGNVVGSSLLNVLADNTGLRLRPSPPTVMVDMAGALLDAVAPRLLMTQDDVLVVDALLQQRESVASWPGMDMGEGQRVAGANLLGDGRVVLILDVADLAKAVAQAMPGVTEARSAGSVSVATRGDRSVTEAETDRPKKAAA